MDICITRMKTVRHGMYHTRQYGIWAGMKSRCYNPNNETHKRYGAKGITLSEKWKNSFLGFWDDMKDGYKDNLTLDRIDNNKGYSKENCRWATWKQQAQNKKGVTLYTFGNKTMSADDWSKELGLKKKTVYARIKFYGWDITKAITTQKRKYDGVSFDRARKKWIVYMHKNGKKIFIGRFNTKKEALQERKRSD